MQRRVNQKVDTYTRELKDEIKKSVVGAFEKIERVLPQENSKQVNIILKEMMDIIYNFPLIQLEEDDFARRKRAKNIVPYYDRCQAMRANNEQCTRRKKCGSNFCGTHVKGTPHGVVKCNNESGNKTKNVSVWAEEISGIMYYIDDNYNVYQAEDIMLNKINPKVIAKYEKKTESGGEVSYSIPDFNI